jgi:hypothetical protein
LFATHPLSNCLGLLYIHRFQIRHLRFESRVSYCKELDREVREVDSPGSGNVGEKAQRGRATFQSPTFATPSRLGKLNEPPALDGNISANVLGSEEAANSEGGKTSF